MFLQINIGVRKQSVLVTTLKLAHQHLCLLEVVYGFAYLKKAAAFTNCELGVLSSEKRDLIAQVCDEILAGKHDNQFPVGNLANWFWYTV